MNFFLAAFTSYGAFWLSFGAIYIPGAGITAAYADPTTGIINESELASALGIYLITWCVVTFLLL